MRNWLMTLPLIPCLLAAPVQAGGLFRKGDKPDPSLQVPALIQMLKAEKDERLRAAAAAALREFDAKAYPDILPALTDALAHDASPGVRSEAADSIGNIRPISAQAGYALEQAIAKDPSLPVRLSARTAMLKYRLLGFIGGKTDLSVQSGEPPLADGPELSRPGSTVLRPTPSPIPVTTPVGPPTPPVAISPALPPGQGLIPRPNPQTDEPPLAEPTPAPALTTQPKAPVPIITIPSPPDREAIIPVPTVPRDGPSLLPSDVATPPAKPSDDGPALPAPPK